MEKFILPDDIDIIKSLNLEDENLIFCGGFVDYLHTNKYKLNEQVFFNDLDIVVTNKFIDKMSNYFEHLDHLIKSKKFTLSYFGLDGTVLSEPKREIYFENSKYGFYPRQMRMYIEGKMIDLFIRPFEMQDFIEIDLLGIKLKIQSLESRKKNIRSILDKKFMNNKEQIFKKKLKELEKQ
jgi:hypothetical protein